MAYELWSHHFLPIDGLHPYPRFPAIRQTLRRQLQSQELLLLGSVALYGIRPADLPGKPERHRSVSASGTKQAVSLRHPGEGLKEHSGQCESDKGMENLYRFCPDPHSTSKSTLRRRVLRNRTRSDGLCAGRNGHRSVPVALFPGIISENTKERSSSIPFWISREVFPPWRLSLTARYTK